MLFTDIISVYCENHTRQINTLCGENAESFNGKAGSTYSNHSALTCQHVDLVLLKQRLRFLTTPWRDQQMAAVNGVQTDSVQVRLTTCAAAANV